jgi:tetratricopeptide (TPR) repeat protein
MAYPRQSADLDVAVRRAREAVMNAPIDHPQRGILLWSLGLALLARYSANGNSADLNRSISTLRRAAPAVAPGEHGAPLYLSNLAAAIKQWYLTSCDAADLNEAISLGCDAMASQATTAILDPTGPANAPLLAALQQLLLIGLRRQPNAATIYKCVAADKLLLERSPDNTRRAAVLSTIALVKQALFDVSRDIRVLDEAIRTLQAAVDADPRIDWSSNLSNSLQRRLERLGTLDDLKRSVQASRRAVEEAAADRPCAKHLSNLAIALRTRYEGLGEPRDLDQGVEIGRRAISSVAPDDPDRPMLLSNHSIALRLPYKALHRRGRLDGAVEAARTAVRLSDVHERHRPGRLTDVSGLVVTRFLHSGADSDLDEDLAAGPESVSTLSASDPGLPLFLSNVAAALAYHDEAQEAAERLRLAIELSPADHPDRAKYVSSRANVLATRSRHDDMLAEQVLEAWQDAVLSTAAPVRLLAAHARAHFAAESGSRWNVAGKFYARAAELLPLLVLRGLQRASREALLSRWAGLPRDRVAAATEPGDPQHGLPSVEQGVRWFQVVDVRTDLQALDRAEPVLTAGLARVRAELEALDNRLGVRGDS